MRYNNDRCVKEPQFYILKEMILKIISSDLLSDGAFSTMISLFVSELMVVESTQAKMIVGELFAYLLIIARNEEELKRVLIAIKMCEKDLSYIRLPDCLLGRIYDW